MALIGKSVPRPDGPAKVTGRARYVDDVVVPGMLVGATLRSSVPRGRLRGIVKDPSFDWNGLTVVTAEDVPTNVVSLIEEDQPVLASNDVRHVGEPLALVAGEDALRVRRALHHLRADIEPLPPVLSVSDALSRVAQIYGSDNVFRTIRIAKGDAAAAIAACAVQLSGTYETPHQEQLYIEPQGVVASWDADGGAHVLRPASARTTSTRRVKRTFSLTDERVDVTQAVTGGGFGGKEEYPTIIALHALLLAQGERPARADDLRPQGGHRGDDEAPPVARRRSPRAATATARCGPSRSGVVLDGGAYVTLSPVVLSRGALHAAGRVPLGRTSRSRRRPSRRTRRRTARSAASARRRRSGRSSATWTAWRGSSASTRSRCASKNVLRAGDTTPTGQVLRESVGVGALRRGGEEGAPLARRRSARQARASRVPPPPAAPARAQGPRHRRRASSCTAPASRARASVVSSARSRSISLAGRAALARPRRRRRTSGRAPRRCSARSPPTPLGVRWTASTSRRRRHAPRARLGSHRRLAHGHGRRRSIVERRLRSELVARVRGRDRQANGGTFAEAADRLLAARRRRSRVELQYEPPPASRWDDATYKRRRVPGLRLGLRRRRGRGGPRHVRGRPSSTSVERARRRQGASTR